MCIQFVCINNQPGPDGYKLIVCENRDERYDKPTTPASFWPSDASCISGMSNGRTWFGVSKTGKVGALLNVMTTATEGPCGTKPRGSLVVDYLAHQDSAEDYLAKLKPESYLPYNLVLLERNCNGQWKCHYQTNSSCISESVTMEDGIYGFGNTNKDNPLTKVKEGQREFSAIIEENQSIFDMKTLQDNLLCFMGNDKQYLPDPLLDEEYGHSTGVKYSSIYTEVPEHNIGTRSTTLLIVTADDRCVYTEQSYTPVTSGVRCYTVRSEFLLEDEA